MTAAHVGVTAGASSVCHHDGGSGAGWELSSSALPATVAKAASSRLVATRVEVEYAGLAAYEKCTFAEKWRSAKVRKLKLPFVRFTPVTRKASSSRPASEVVSSYLM